MSHPAILRPGMYAGDQLGRTREQFLVDALMAYGTQNGIHVNMDTNERSRLVTGIERSEIIRILTSKGQPSQLILQVLNLLEKDDEQILV